MDTEKRIYEILTDNLGIDPNEITFEARLVDDLGADELDTAELAMALEEEFDIEIPDDEAEKLITVGDVIKCVERQQ